MQQDKVGKIPEHVAPILSRIDLDPPSGPSSSHFWVVELVKSFDRCRKTLKVSTTPATARTRVLDLDGPLDGVTWCASSVGCSGEPQGTPESLAEEAIRCGQGWLSARENHLDLSSDESDSSSLPTPKSEEWLRSPLRSDRHATKNQSGSAEVRQQWTA